ncbi:putative ubiquitin carboxyl-terminal hydrolase creB, partial [Neolecta irregularis DAH-3]
MAVELLPHPPHLFPVMWKWISAAGSSPQKNQTHSQNGPPLLKIYGLENFGTSCYANSILQSLFHSPVFRHAVLSYPDHIYPVFERLPSRKVAPRRILPPGYSLERVPEIKGVVLGVSLAKSYGMEECMFTALRDLYILMSDYSYDSSVICPTRFMEVMGTCN